MEFLFLFPDTILITPHALSFLAGLLYIGQQFFRVAADQPVLRSHMGHRFYL